MDDQKILQQWSSMTYKERSLKLVKESINEICQNHNFPEIVSTKAYDKYIVLTNKYVQGERKIIIRGARRKAIIVVCILESCCEENLTLDQFAKNMFVENMEIDTDTMDSAQNLYNKLMKETDTNS